MRGKKEHAQKCVCLFCLFCESESKSAPIFATLRGKEEQVCTVMCVCVCVCMWCMCVCGCVCAYLYVYTITS